MFCELGGLEFSLVTCCFLDKYLANVKFRMAMALFLVNYNGGRMLCRIVLSFVSRLPGGLRICSFIVCKKNHVG
jgi:hypothetical protein